jgi:sulfatase modifying factor 1
MRSTHQPQSHRVAAFLLASGPAFLGVSLFASTAAASFSTAAKSCPSDMTLVGHTCVDKWEGSLVAMNDDGTETAFDADEAPNGRAVRAVSRPGVAPQAHISMLEAQRACRSSGKRLCHAAEWKTACEGPEHTRYPYGQTREANVCVDTNRTSPMAVLHNGEHTARTMNDPEANELANTVEPTGEASECTNGYGVYDMVGNVHEWADDGAFHGGYYLDTKINGEGCNYVTTAHAKNYYDYSTGFRCCADEGTLEDDAAPEAPAPKQEAADMKPAPRPTLHAAPGSNADDDGAPTAEGTNEVSDGDRKSVEPIEMIQMLTPKL